MKSIKELKESNARDEELINALLTGIVCVTLTIPVGVLVGVLVSNFQGTITHSRLNK